MQFAFIPNFTQPGLSGQCFDRHLLTYQIKTERNGFVKYLASSAQAANRMADADGYKFDPYATRVQSLGHAIAPVVA